MLLLVFVLVLIALGMLAVALLTSSVLWGWIALVLSAAAAVVLLIDWLQRRSAVKAGSSSVRAANTAVAPGPMPGFGQPSEAGLGAFPEGRFGSPQAPADDIDPVTEVLPHVVDSAEFESGNATADTAVLPVIGPSGSAEQPPGAPEVVTRTGGDPSPSVAASEVVPEAEDDAAARPGGQAQPLGAVGPQDAPGSPEDDTTPATGGPPAVEAGGVTAIGPPESGGVVDTEPPGEGAPGDAAAPDQPGDHHSGDEPASHTASEPAQGGPDGSLLGSDDIPQADPDGQPPEEPRDAEIAAVVAGLEEEVLVVDEQPRYHLARCRSLQGKPLIPLPVREAVELGFTPCGWCTPDQVLAGDRAQTR